MDDLMFIAKMFGAKRFEDRAARRSFILFECYKMSIYGKPLRKSLSKIMKWNHF